MFILASSSPRRKELLESLNINFSIISPAIDENIVVAEHEYLPFVIAKLKAYHVLSMYKDAIVLAADTIVLLDNKVLGKPHDRKEAYEMLKALSGRHHDVITAYTLVSNKMEINRQVTTHVYFNTLSEQLIEDYLNCGSYKDKAGGYGIQDPYPLISHIDGSYSNVMGLPLEKLQKDLEKILKKEG